MILIIKQEQIDVFLSTFVLFLQTYSKVYNQINDINSVKSSIHKVFQEMKQINLRTFLLCKLFVALFLLYW